MVADTIPRIPVQPRHILSCKFWKGGNEGIYKYKSPLTRTLQPINQSNTSCIQPLTPNMKFSAISAITLGGFLATPMANPIVHRQISLCGSSLTPQCCGIDVLGIIDVDCRTPPSRPISFEDFQDSCGASGYSAKCCVLPVAGQGVLCNDPVGA